MKTKAFIVFTVILINLSAWAEPLRIGIASILSPDESLSLYYEFNNYIGTKMGRKVNTIIKRDYDVMNQMIKNNKVDVASICTGAMAYLNEEDVRVVAVPEADGKHSYRSYIITNKIFDINSLADLKDKEFAFTDRLSYSGTIYPSYLLINHFSKAPEEVLRRIYYTNSHDKSIFLVNKGVVQAAAVDSLIFNYIKKNKPEEVSNINIIHKSPEVISPPIVVSSVVTDKVLNKLRMILLNMDKDPEGEKILKFLNIDRFVKADIKEFSEIREISEAIEKHNINSNSEKFQ